MSNIVEEKALELLENGIDENCVVYVDGFNKRHIFERLLIQVGRKNKLTVLLNKDSKRIEFLRRERRYKHIHNAETLKVDINKRTPKKVIIADNVSFKSVAGLEEKYELVGGFRYEFQDDKEHDKEIDEILEAMYEKE